MDYPCTAILKLKRNIQEIPHRPTNSILPIWLHIKHKETTTAGTKEFSAQCPGCNSFCIELINTIRGYGRACLTFQLPCVIQHPAKIIQRAKEKLSAALSGMEEP